VVGLALVTEPVVTDEAVEAAGIEPNPSHKSNRLMACNFLHYGFGFFGLQPLVGVPEFA
jgi:hypothetical protein